MSKHASDMAAIQGPLFLSTRIDSILSETKPTVRLQGRVETVRDNDVSQLTLSLRQFHWRIAIGRQSLPAALGRTQRGGGMTGVHTPMRARTARMSLGAISFTLGARKWKRAGNEYRRIPFECCRRCLLHSTHTVVLQEKRQV